VPEKFEKLSPATSACMERMEESEEEEEEEEEDGKGAERREGTEDPIPRRENTPRRQISLARSLALRPFSKRLVERNESESASILE